MANFTKWPWKVVAISLIILLALIVMAEFKFLVLTKIWFSYSQKREALLDIKNAQIKHNTFQLKYFRKGRINRSNTSLFEVIEKDNNFTIASDASNQAKTLKDSVNNELTIGIEDVYLEENVTFNEQAYTVFNRYDGDNGSRINNIHYAVLSDRIVPLDPANEAPLISLMPSFLSGSDSQSVVFTLTPDHECWDTLGYFNRGDLITIDPVEKSKLTWDRGQKVYEGKDIGLGGTYGTPNSRHEIDPEDFPACRLPIGALLFKFPGEQPQVIVRKRSLFVSSSGYLVSRRNTRKGINYLNEGGVVELTLTLQPGT